MIELTTLTTQIIPVGGAITFENVALHSGCGECFNKMIPQSVKLRGNGIYGIEFGGNVTNQTAGAPVQLAIAIGGSAVPQTARTVTPATAGDLWAICTGTFLRNCCCDIDRISVINTGSNPVVIAPNASLRISRKS